MKKFSLLTSAVLGSLLIVAPAFAQSTLPAWDQLSSAQRNALTAQIQSHWDSATPEMRTRMMERATKWASMTPEQRAAARKGRMAWGKMSPEARDARRAVYYKVQSLDDTQRKAFFESFRKMTPEQRAAWVKANPVPAGAEVKMPMHKGKHHRGGKHMGSGSGSGSADKPAK